MALANRHWQDDNPWFLVIRHDEVETIIDLGQQGWLQDYKNLLRVEAQWYLIHKQGQLAPLVLQVHEGDQPYYTARHVGITGSGGGNEITAYGIGKKCADGSMVRMWVLPNGLVCGGDDVDELGVMLVRRMGPK